MPRAGVRRDVPTVVTGVMVPTGWWLLLPVAAMAVLTVLGQLLDRVLGVGAPGLADLLWLVNVNAEGNLPSWYSAGLLLIAAAVSWSIGVAHTDDGRARAWRLLCGAALLLSIEEIVHVVPRAKGLLTAVLGGGGLFPGGWTLLVLPMLLAATVVWAAVQPEVPRAARRLFALAVLLQVLGAVVLDAAAAAWWRWQDAQFSMAHVLLDSSGELAEAAAAVLLVRACAQVLAPGVPAQPGRSAS